MSEVQIPDAAARDAAKADLEHSTFLAAGAGAGKSTTLVDRIVNTLLHSEPEVGIEQIVAITFTEKAGSELRHKLRQRLTLAHQLDGDPRIGRALERVDSANVGTIHSFAQSLLRRFALEAGLPPGFTLAPESESSAERSRRAKAALETTPEFAAINQLLRRGRVPLQSLIELVEDYDKLLLRVSDSLPEPSTNLHAERASALSSKAKRIFAELEAACLDRSDRLMVLLVELHAQVQDLARLTAEESVRQYGELQGLNGVLPLVKTGAVGSAKNWTLVPKDVRDTWKSLEPDIWACLTAPLETAVFEVLGQAQLTLRQSRETRRAAGEIEFDDLLHFTRELLSDGDVGERVRRRLFDDFRVVMVDEFQDTDPVQWEIIRLLTSDPAADDGRPAAGRLVLVGDPKQAIYSFRGADISTYLAALELFEGPAALGPVRKLSANFRTLEPILRWANEVFEGAMSQPGQVEFEPLATVRQAPTQTGFGPFVTVLRDDPAAADLSGKVMESRLVTQTVLRAVSEGWQVTEGAVGAETVRAATFRDIAVLYPTRSSLDALLNECDQAGIPYRSSDARIVLQRPAVIGVLNLLRTVLDPTGSLALWQTLKSPLYGCTDADLAAYRLAGGKWTGPVAAELRESRVGRALEGIAALRWRLATAQPVSAIAEICAETRVFEVLAGSVRGQFDADCLRMVSAHAQQWQDEGGVGLSAYLDLVAGLEDPSARSSFAPPADAEDDAITLMTVYGAKGLEFNIAIVAGMSTKPRLNPPAVAIDHSGNVQFSLSKHISSEGYARWKEQEYEVLQLAERMRVLYVACTRARDHLVLSLCGEGKANTPSALLAPFVPRGDGDVCQLETVQPLEERRAPAAPVEPGWEQRISSVRAAAKVRAVQLPSGSAAAALGVGVSGQAEPAATERQAESTIEMSLRARDGAVFGQCVHAALDLLMSRGAGSPTVAEAVRIAALRLGVSVDLEIAAAVVQNALASPLLLEAKSAQRLWTELHLAAPVAHEGARLVEGFADLVFETETGGLVVVDYKTDSSISAETMAHYRDQLGAYAELLSRATGGTVQRKFVLHLTAQSAKAIEIG